MPSSPLPMNTSKIHLYMEYFFLRMNWKLAEGLLYNQVFKKDTHVTGANRRKTIRSGPVLLRGDLGKGRLQIPTLGSEQVKTQTGCPSPGVLHGEDKLSWLVGGLLGQAERLGKTGLCSWGVLAHRLAPETGQREVCLSKCLLGFPRQLHNAPFGAKGNLAPLTPCHKQQRI